MNCIKSHLFSNFPTTMIFLKTTVLMAISSDKIFLGNIPETATITNNILKINNNHVYFYYLNDY